MLVACRGRSIRADLDYAMGSVSARVSAQRRNPLALELPVFLALVRGQRS
jgi:hypothetical protein